MKAIRLEHIGTLALLSGIGVLLFFFLYSINFTFLPTFTSRLIAIGVIGYLLWNFWSRGEITFSWDRSSLMIFALWFTLLVWVLWRTLATDFTDPNWLVNTILLLLQVFAGSLFFAWWFYNNGWSFRFMVRMIQICLVIQALFIIVYFFSWEFKHLTLRFIPEGGNVPALHPYRSRGITHHASASLAAFQATGLLLTAYLIVKARSWREVLLDTVAAGLLVGSIFVTGRSGFLVLPFLFAFFVCHALLNNRIGRKITTYAVVLPVALIAGFFGMEFVYVQLGGWAAPWGGGDAFRSMTAWTFGEYEDLLTEGRSRTTDVLLREHWFFPQQAGLLALGDPTTYELNRVSSDIGVVRRIFGLGLTGALLTYLLVFAILYHSAWRASDSGERLLIVFYGLWIFMLEFKEPFVTDFRFSALYLMIFCYLCLMPLQQGSRMKIGRPDPDPGCARPGRRHSPAR